MNTACVGEAPLKHGTREVIGGQVEIGGERSYRIRHS